MLLFLNFTSEAWSSCARSIDLFLDGHDSKLDRKITGGYTVGFLALFSIWLKLTVINYKVDTSLAKADIDSARTPHQSSTSTTYLGILQRDEALMAGHKEEKEVLVNETELEAKNEKEVHNEGVEEDEEEKEEESNLTLIFAEKSYKTIQVVICFKGQSFLFSIYSYHRPDKYLVCDSLFILIIICYCNMFDVCFVCVN